MITDSRAPKIRLYSELPHSELPLATRKVCGHVLYAFIEAGMVAATAFLRDNSAQQT